MTRGGFAGVLAVLAVVGAIISVGLLAAGPIVWRLDWWHYRVGLLWLMPGAASFGGAAAVTGIVSLALGFGVMRRRAAVSALLAVLGGTVAIGVPWSWVQMRGAHPPINDITTDTERPPAFKTAASLRKGLGVNSVDYGGAAVARQQQAAYADIVPVRTALAPAAAYAKALAAAEGMGWTVSAKEEGEGRIEASDRTRWFGFTDDIVIRVEADAAGSRIDIRSQSRLGRGDFGANARRVRAYLAALKAALGG